jgi:hypothetical protein
LGCALTGAQQDQRRRDDRGGVLEPRPFEAELGQNRLDPEVVEGAQEIDVEGGRVRHSVSI